MAERRRQSPHFEPTRVLRAPGGGWSGLAVALVAAMGVLVGVLLIALLGGGGTRVETRTQVQRVTVPVTVAAPAATTPGPAIVTTQVPDVVGERLDVARDRMKRAGFDVDVDGGGTFGVVIDSNWVVVAETPAAGTSRELGSLVRLSIERA